MVRELVTDPDGFMRRKVGQANIRVEILLVMLVGILSVPGVLYISLQVLDVREAAEMRFVVVGRLLRPILIIFILWIVYSLAFHLISAHYRGRGAPSRVLKGVAWAFLPIGLGNLVQSLALFLMYRNANVPDLLEGYDSAAQMQSLFDTGMSDPVLILATLIFAGTLLWSGYLMTFAVQHAKNISHEQAIRVVAVPLGVHLLVIIWALIQGTTNFGLVLFVN